MNKRDFIKTLGTAAVAAPIAAITARQTGPTVMVKSGDEDISERVLREGVIRAAYVVYPPFFTKDVNTGKLGGFTFEIAEQMAKTLGLKIEWVEEVFWGNSLEGLNTNRYDIVGTQVWPNGPRLRQADFCMPLFFSAVGAYARPEDAARFSDLNRINSNDVVICTVDGEISDILSRTRFSNAKTLSLPQNTSIDMPMMNVMHKKADIVFNETAIVNDFLAKNPGALVSIAPAKPVQVYPNGFPIKRRQFAWRSMIDGAFSEMANSGSVEDLLTKYETHKGDFYRVAAPYQTPMA